ncbi:hypothetical protein [Ruania zhangjianzhongii]|uniref:hypothetical protein n=1 Tax=Ruania zhangjianzhongii TaxID=2603206 RepID=UPI001F1DCC15|nr:hypothetical protein [Ruania zhangjianzhongii]
MNGSEIVILLVLVAVIVGPQRLPQYAEQLARLVRTLRDMARGATQSIKEELGPEAADLDFTKLDPRQYDPRRIVRDALAEDLSSTGSSSSSRKSRSSSSGSSGGSSNSAGTAAATAGTAAAGAATTKAAAAPTDSPAPEDVVDPLADGAPFDSEAT